MSKHFAAGFDTKNLYVCFNDQEQCKFITYAKSDLRIPLEVEYLDLSTDVDVVDGRSRTGDDCSNSNSTNCRTRVWAYRLVQDHDRVYLQTFCQTTLYLFIFYFNYFVNFILYI